MRLPRIRRAAAALAAAAALVITTMAHPAAASADPATIMDRPSGAAAEEVAAALQRDLGVTAAKAAQWLAASEAAAATLAELRDELGGHFGGAWLADDGTRLVVGVTDPVAAGQVRAAGADARLVSRSLTELAATKAALDRAEAPDPAVTGWYVDVAANSVVVEVTPYGQRVAQQFISNSGADNGAVRIEVTTDSPQLLQYPLREGDPYYIGNGRCTIGALVQTATGQNGFLTAGHCGGVGASTHGFNFQPQGTFRASVFPGRDGALVQVNDDWIPEPIFAGTAEAPIGAAVCKIGSTTGLTCGILTARNQSVNYPQGVVHGLGRTTICSEPGDSGGPVFAAGYQLQGVVSGGSGNCRTGGITFFQPIRPLLAAWNLTLITA